MNEKWVWIPNYKGWYKVSTLGELFGVNKHYVWQLIHHKYRRIKNVLPL